MLRDCSWESPPKLSDCKRSHRDWSANSLFSSLSAISPWVYNRNKAKIANYWYLAQPSSVKRTPAKEYARLWRTNIPPYKYMFEYASSRLSSSHPAMISNANAQTYISSSSASSSSICRNKFLTVYRRRQRIANASQVLTSTTLKDAVEALEIGDFDHALE